MTKRQLYSIIYPERVAKYNKKHYARITKPMLERKYYGKA